ncbi:sodium-coupled monocarboxylate transporter 1 [Rhipicephalus sanguineus]|uniref:sodium-coupled monocarboxylate transporter 1 n=1 Tax=Rhipicephalus sanguineus TaxID=34632 RepID=UPI0018961C43|nr:sodium-coupled monocarboxylate transporter 1 [Rhipicephalus sanguineus]
MPNSTFTAIDYAVLIGSLMVPVSIGTYYAWLDRKRTTNREFLIASRQMGWFPVSLSMVASFLSATSMLGLPSEVFVRGSVLWIGSICACIAIVVAAFVFLPVYYNMDLTSINEYLERRFSSTAVRNLASALFIIQTLLYMGIVLYGPSLALGSVTGLPVWSAILLNGFVCTFYTAAGGMKAVVWTDTVQMALIYTGYIMVIAAGVHHSGGFNAIWRTARDGGRLVFVNFSVSPYETYTTWNCIIAGTLNWLAIYCASQTQIQRYSSISSLKHSRWALLMNIPGVALVYILSVLSGLILYVVYHDCDPRLTGDIYKADELMPHAVQTVLQGYPGLAGLFVAAVFSGSLSTLSSGYSALAALTWDDFVRPRVNISDVAALRLSRCIAAAYGLLSISVAFLAGSMESIVHATVSLQGALYGPLVALFALGMFAPCCKKKGALTGTILAVGTSVWLVMGGIVYPRRWDALPTSTAGCSNFSETVTSGYNVSAMTPRGLFRFYHISFMWVIPVGFLVHVIVSLVVSTIFERNTSEHVDPKYVWPFVRSCMMKPTPRMPGKEDVLMEPLSKLSE